MVRVPVNEGFGRAEAALWSAAVTSYGTIMAAPLWWDIDGIRVLGWCAVGCAAVYAVLRGATVIPGMIRKIRKVLRRREPEWLIPVYSVRGRDSFGGYVPREAICRAAKGNR